MSFVFGPVASRRFGVSLGVDLSPDQKRCNFDCLYCELQGAKTVSVHNNPAPPETIAAEVAAALKQHTVDVITLTANGEPTLYPYLDRLITLLEPLKGAAKLMILSNGATLVSPDVAVSLARLDQVKLSLDCATERCFKKLDRPHTGGLKAIIEAMIAFRNRYAGTLILEVLTVEGINDNSAEFSALADAMRLIKPDRIDVGTIERPPAYGVKGVGYEKLDELCRHLSDLPVNIIPVKHNLAPQTLTEGEILATLARRSMSTDEAVAILDSASRMRLNTLLKEERITTRRQGGKTFYVLSQKP